MGSAPGQDVGNNPDQHDAVHVMDSGLAEDMVMHQAVTEDGAIQSVSGSVAELNSARVRRRRTKAEFQFMERRRIREQWEIQRKELRWKVVCEQLGTGPIIPGGHWSPGGHGTSLEDMFSLA